MKINVKKATKENIKDIFLIEQTCFSTPWTEQSIADSVSNNSNYFNVAYVGDKPAGYMSMQLVQGEGDIMRVAVLPEFRRLGVGRALLDECFSVNNPDAVFLDVRENNTPAIRLYESFGFVNIGIRKNYYSNPTENAVMMKKTVDKAVWLDNDKMFCLYEKIIAADYLTNMPFECPVCREKSAHIYFNRCDSSKGGFWSWCSACKAFVHSFTKVPAWWKNCSDIKTDCLTAIPDYLETNKIAVNSWIISLLQCD